MALGTLAGMKSTLGISSTDATRDEALAALLVQAEAAVLKLTAPYEFANVTRTWTLNAPWQSPWLLLPSWPVRSITSILYNPTAAGDTTTFDADLHTLTQYTDYMLEIDDPKNGWSRSGRVRRLNRSMWGVSYERPLGRLGFGPIPEAGSLRVTAVCGHLTIPEDVTLALYLATRLLYERRAGAPVTSSSWNGYSESLAGPFTATAAVTSPDVLQLLSPYMSQIRVG